MTKLELIGLLADLSILGGVIIMLLCMPIMIYFAYKEHKAEQQTAQAEQEPEDGEIVLSEKEVDEMLEKYDRLLSDHLDLKIERDLLEESEQRYKRELDKHKSFLFEEVARREESERNYENLLSVHAGTVEELADMKADYEALSKDYAELKQKANEK